MTFLKNISPSPLSDDQLVGKYRQNPDLQILGSLYQRYMDLVYGVCLKYLKEPGLAQDAVMNIFEELVKKLHKHEVDNFKGWLYTLAKNHCLMHLRSQKHKSFVTLNTELVQSEEDPHLNGIFEREENFVKLDKCLESLSTEQEETIRMFYLEEKSYKEISGITGRDWPKIKSLVQNGRRNLKICMDGK